MMPPKRSKKTIVKEDIEREGKNAQNTRSRKALTGTVVKAVMENRKETKPVKRQCKSIKEPKNEQVDNNSKMKLRLKKVQDPLSPQSELKTKKPRCKSNCNKGKVEIDDDTGAIRTPGQLRCRTTVSKCDSILSKPYVVKNSEIDIKLKSSPSIENDCILSDSIGNKLFHKQSSILKEMPKKRMSCTRNYQMKITSVEKGCVLNNIVNNALHKKSTEKSLGKEKVFMGRNQHGLNTYIDNDCGITNRNLHNSLRTKPNLVEKRLKKKCDSDKENFNALSETPTLEKFDKSIRANSIEYHSTPSSEKLDDSLFGFNLIDRIPTPIEDFSNITMSSIMTTADKNMQVVKKELTEEPLLDNIPIEIKKKRQKKKKAIVKKKPVDELDELLGQFDEVEMHELAVE